MKKKICLYIISPIKRPLIPQFV